MKINFKNTLEFPVIAGTKIISMNTLDNWLWARDRAHNLKYEAVFEMDPTDYNIIFIKFHFYKKIFYFL
jgi:hypothetical protein